MNVGYRRVTGTRGCAAGFGAATGGKAEQVAEGRWKKKLPELRVFSSALFCEPAVFIKETRSFKVISRFILFKVFLFFTAQLNMLSVTTGRT